MNKNDIILLWLEKAENDLQNIRNNLIAEIKPIDTICFHSQQAIEKCLKAILIFLDKPITKTHDLTYLLNEIGEYFPQFSHYSDSFDNITDFAVEIRYPYSQYKPDLEDATSAFQTANTFYTQVKELITYTELNS